MPLWFQASLWGLLAGSALLIGAAIGYRARISPRVTAGVMAFGAGVLISALSFELMDEAFATGGFDSTAIGFVLGAVVYTAANRWLSARGARHRKRSGPHQLSEADQSGSGTALALGALLDGIPESIAIGLSLVQGGVVSVVTVIAIFLSNLPEGLSSAAGMRKAGRPASYVFGVWATIALVSGVASFVGYSVFQNLSPGFMAATTAVAAGAILAMLADTMMPEAFADAHDMAGLITVVGFLASFALSKLAG